MHLLHILPHSHQCEGHDQWRWCVGRACCVWRIVLRKHGIVVILSLPPSRWTIWIITDHRKRNGGLSYPYIIYSHSEPRRYLYFKHNGYRTHVKNHKIHKDEDKGKHHWHQSGEQAAYPSFGGSRRALGLTRIFGLLPLVAKRNIISPEVHTKEGIVCMYAYVCMYVCICIYIHTYMCVCCVCEWNYKSKKWFIAMT